MRFTKKYRKLAIEKRHFTSLDQVNGLQLDLPTTLQTFEQPSLSTEPQPEPWSAPNAGYQWFNTNTFKPGSYMAITVQ